MDAIGNSSQLIRKELKTPNKAALHLAAGILGLEEAEKECKEEEGIYWSHIKIFLFFLLCAHKISLKIMELKCLKL